MLIAVYCQGKVRPQDILQEHMLLLIHDLSQRMNLSFARHQMQSMRTTLAHWREAMIGE